MTDGQTDRRTSCDGIVRAMHTRRALKTVQERAIFTSGPIESYYGLSNGASFNDLEEPQGPSPVIKVMLFLTLNIS